MEYPRGGYLKHLPLELHGEIRKFQRGHYPKCDPLLFVGSLTPEGDHVTIRGIALTQLGTHQPFALPVYDRDIPLLARELEDLELGGPGPMVFYRRSGSHIDCI